MTQKDNLVFAICASVMPNFDFSDSILEVCIFVLPNLERSIQVCVSVKPKVDLANIFWIAFFIEIKNDYDKAYALRGILKIELGDVDGRNDLMMAGKYGYVNANIFIKKYCK